MASLIARKWPQSRLVSHPLDRLPRRRACLTTTAVRSYAQAPGQLRDTLVPFHGGIIIPHSIPDASPASLIKHIRPVPHENVSRNTFCIFFVTPSFASWLLRHDAFLAKALERLYAARNADSAADHPQAPIKVQALCAVVDKVPASRPIVGDTIQSDSVFTAKKPLVGETGHEGIAYATLPAAASLPMSYNSSSDKAAVDFRWHCSKTTEPSFDSVVRLPLANTVFQTGRPWTMNLSTWSSQDKAPYQLVHEENQDLPNHSIALDTHDTSKAMIKSDLSIPVLPLTVARRVVGGMGNIVRQVIGDDDAPMTASAELEEAVPRYFKARGEPAQATTVWALVIPGKSSDRVSRMAKTTAQLLTGPDAFSDDLADVKPGDWERLWGSTTAPRWTSMLNAPLAEGGRLHRVLSGGGGWGKKAGLLSLDPVPERLALGGDDMLLNEAADPTSFASTLAPVVQEGDSIQFFISPQFKSGQNEQNQELLKVAASSTPRWSWELGTIPSTIDNLPGQSWQHSSSATDAVTVISNTFGGLSEGGLTVLRGHRPAAGFVPVAQSTIVDVPFSRVRAVEVKLDANKSLRGTEDPSSKFSAQTAGLRLTGIRRQINRIRFMVHKIVPLPPNMFDALSENRSTPSTRPKEIHKLLREATVLSAKVSYSLLVSCMDIQQSSRVLAQFHRRAHKLPKPFWKIKRAIMGISMNKTNRLRIHKVPVMLKVRTHATSKGTLAPFRTVQHRGKGMTKSEKEEKGRKELSDTVSSWL